jgi:hypothetical protein
MVLNFSVTAHTINDEFEREFDLIACLPMYDRGTGINIANGIEEACMDVGIPMKKVVVLLRDGANAMISAAKILGVESFDCFIHKLQLCVRKATEPFENKIADARKVCSFFNKSSNFHRDFMARSNKGLIKASSRSMFQSISLFYRMLLLAGTLQRICWIA